METSAKTGQNARNVLVEAAKILYQDYLKLDENNKDNNNGTNKSDGQRLIKKKEKKDKKGCC